MKKQAILDDLRDAVGKHQAGADDDVVLASAIYTIQMFNRWRKLAEAVVNRAEVLDEEEYPDGAAGLNDRDLLEMMATLGIANGAQLTEAIEHALRTAGLEVEGDQYRIPFKTIEDQAHEAGYCLVASPGPGQHVNVEIPLVDEETHIRERTSSRVLAFARVMNTMPNISQVMLPDDVTKMTAELVALILPGPKVEMVSLGGNNLFDLDHPLFGAPPVEVIDDVVKIDDEGVKLLGEFSIYKEFFDSMRSKITTENVTMAELGQWVSFHFGAVDQKLHMLGVILDGEDSAVRDRAYISEEMSPKELEEMVVWEQAVRSPWQEVGKRLIINVPCRGGNYPDGAWSEGDVAPIVESGPGGATVEFAPGVRVFFAWNEVSSGEPIPSMPEVDTGGASIEEELQAEEDRPTWAVMGAVVEVKLTGSVGPIVGFLNDGAMVQLPPGNIPSRYPFTWDEIQPYDPTAEDDEPDEFDGPAWKAPGALVVVRGGERKGMKGTIDRSFENTAHVVFGDGAVERMAWETLRPAPEMLWQGPGHLGYDGDPDEPMPEVDDENLKAAQQHEG